MARLRLQPAIDLCTAMGIDPALVRRIYLNWGVDGDCDIIVTVADHKGLLETIKRYKWVEVDSRGVVK